VECPGRRVIQIPRTRRVCVVLYLYLISLTGDSRRFPIVSGLRVSWDSRRPPGQRVLGIWLLQEVAVIPSGGSGTSSGTGTPALVDGEFVKREKNGRTYKIVTRNYLATGHDGYTTLPGHRYLIDDENGQLMSSLVRKYLLGGYGAR
jgi:5'-nucleotidase